MRRLALLLFSAWCVPALAMSSWSTDASDLWWNPAESGWGVNMIQQANKVFATFFVYGADGRARWYVSSDMQGAAAAAGQPIFFRGTLYETSGPVVGPAFDPSRVTRREVGTVTFEYQRPSDGMLTYTVDGATVSKRVTRQTWAMNEIAGDYHVKRATRSSCSGGVAMDALGRVAVRRSGTGVTISPDPGLGRACVYSGIYSQEGRMGRVTGTYACDGGMSGPFTLSEFEVSDMGFTARLQATENGCAIAGNIGGPRATASFPPT